MGSQEYKLGSTLPFWVAVNSHWIRDDLAKEKRDLKYHKPDLWLRRKIIYPTILFMASPNDLEVEIIKCNHTWRN